MAHHERWRALQRHIAASELTIDAWLPAAGEEVDQAPLEALQELNASLLLDMANMRVRLFVIVGETRGRIGYSAISLFSPHREIRELFHEFGRGADSEVGVGGGGGEGGRGGGEGGGRVVGGEGVVVPFSGSDSSEEDDGEDIQERGVGEGGGRGGEFFPYI